MEAAPVEDQKNGGKSRQGIGGRRIIKNPRDSFQRRQWNLAPDFRETRPRPAGWRQHLTEIEVGQLLQRSEGGELEDRIDSAEQREREPDSLETREAAEAVTERLPDRIAEHHDGIAGHQSYQRIQARNVRPHAGL